jgi:hypothetical protein
MTACGPCAPLPSAPAAVSDGRAVVAVVAGGGEGRGTPGFCWLSVPL